jgi:PKD repeat protein
MGYMEHHSSLFWLCMVCLMLQISTVSAAGPDPAFSGIPTAGPAPLTVTFTDSSTGSPTGWAWYFGDEDYSVPWTEQTAGAPWSGRSMHSIVVMPDGNIVLMGGANSGGTLNDVWQSTDNGISWTQITPSAPWSIRGGHSTVVMPDGSIVLMGGNVNYGNNKNDVWRSTDNGVTWTQMTASAPWSGRRDFASVAMPDGSIVVMGGFTDPEVRFNDVWRSTDNGATWTQQISSAPWVARANPGAGVMPDGSILLMGGSSSVYGRMNDIWQSTDQGATWSLVTASAGWSPRQAFGSVVMPDGSIVLMGGNTGSSRVNDIWRSTDNGATWTPLTASAGWSGRELPSTVRMLPDGSIILMGGYSTLGGNMNDVWRFQPVASSDQNPSHTYTIPGTYQVALQSYNAAGYNSVRKSGYISVEVNQPPVLAAIGPKTVDEGVLLTFTVAATDPNTPTTLTYSATDLPTGAAFDPATMTFTWTPGFDQAGSYPVTFIVSDGALTDEETVTITVNHVNQKPVAEAGPDKTVMVMDHVRFDGSQSSDPDGSIVSYSWNYGDGKTGSGVKPTHEYMDAGIFTVTLTVTDNEGATGTDTTTVTVNAPGQQSPTHSIQDVIDLIKSMHLQKGTEKSLVSKLENAIKSLDKHNPNAAEKQLEATIQEINVQRGKKISRGQADTLIAAIKDIIQAISNDDGAPGHHKEHRQKILEMINRIRSMDLPKNTEHAFVATLEDGITALDRNDTASVKSQLEDTISAISDARNSRNLSKEQADTLVSAVEEIARDL